MTVLHLQVDRYFRSSVAAKPHRLRRRRDRQSEARRVRLISPCLHPDHQVARPQRALHKTWDVFLPNTGTHTALGDGGGFLERAPRNPSPMDRERRQVQHDYDDVMGDHGPWVSTPLVSSLSEQLRYTHDLLDNAQLVIRDSPGHSVSATRHGQAAPRRAPVLRPAGQEVRLRGTVKEASHCTVTMPPGHFQIPHHAFHPCIIHASQPGQGDGVVREVVLWAIKHTIFVNMRAAC